MATVEEYLRELLNKKQNNYNYSQNEERAYNYIADLINQWKQTFNNQFIYSSNYIAIEMQRSGSRAKGDAKIGRAHV